jgi:hypothetical protein
VKRIIRQKFFLRNLFFYATIKIDQRQEVLDFPIRLVFVTPTDDKRRVDMRISATTGRTQLSKAAVKRRRDAHALLEKQRWRGAMYMAGYALECKLKAQLMERYNCFHLQELEEEIERRTGERPTLISVRAHHLEYLLGFAPDCEARLQQNETMQQCYVRCNTWSLAWRYLGDDGNQQEAASFLECVDSFYQWLSNNI